MSTIRNISRVGAGTRIGKLCYIRDCTQSLSLCVATNHIHRHSGRIFFFEETRCPSIPAAVALFDRAPATCCKICTSPSGLRLLLQTIIVHIRVLTYRFLVVGSKCYEAILVSTVSCRRVPAVLHSRNFDACRFLYFCTVLEPDKLDRNSQKLIFFSSQMKRSRRNLSIGKYHSISLIYL
jgi:hypothetical protein